MRRGEEGGETGIGGTDAARCHELEARYTHSLASPSAGLVLLVTLADVPLDGFFSEPAADFSSLPGLSLRLGLAESAAEVAFLSPPGELASRVGEAPA